MLSFSIKVYVARRHIIETHRLMVY